jgi:hypothetical protein
MEKFIVGQKIPAWFSGAEDDLSTIIKISPYTGKYPQFFTVIIRATARGTKRGWMEFCG